MSTTIKDKKGEITIELKLKDTSQLNFIDLQPLKGENYVLSISGAKWDRRNSDYEYGGQCCDSLIRDGYFSDKKYEFIFDYWRKYHLNDLKAGTKQQYDYLNSIDHTDFNYDKVIKALDKEGLNTPYSYGSKWLFQPLPLEVIANVRDFIIENNK